MRCAIAPLARLNGFLVRIDELKINDLSENLLFHLRSRQNMLSQRWCWLNGKGVQQWIGSSTSRRACQVMGLPRIFLYSYFIRTALAEGVFNATGLAVTQQRRHPPSAAKEEDGQRRRSDVRAYPGSNLT
jgi:hypothetical protein